LRRLFHLEEDRGTVNREKNSERGRGGDDQSTSRSASMRSSAVTLPQSILFLSVFVIGFGFGERKFEIEIENGRKVFELKIGLRNEEESELVKKRGEKV